MARYNKIEKEILEKIDMLDDLEHSKDILRIVYIDLIEKITEKRKKLENPDEFIKIKALIEINLQF